MLTSDLWEELKPKWPKVKIPDVSKRFGVPSVSVGQ
jgi:hypothetical protein